MVIGDILAYVLLGRGETVAEREDVGSQTIGVQILAPFVTAMVPTYLCLCFLVGKIGIIVSNSLSGLKEEWLIKCDIYCA